MSRAPVVLLWFPLACVSSDPSPLADTTSATSIDPGDDTSGSSTAIASTSTSGADTTSTDASTSTSESSSSTGGEDNGSEEVGTSGEPICPEGEGPPGPAVRKFDVATLACGMMDVCDADDDQCFCAPHFDALNVGPSHYMAVGTDMHKADVWAAGNFQAVYVNDLNTDWNDGGQARADTLMADVELAFDCGVPEWFIVNEISAGTWPDNDEYRQFVIDFATAMDIDYGKSVVIAAPFGAPGSNGADWAALAEHAFIAAEQYLSGHEINMNGNSVAWCTDRYQETIDAYAARGVGLDRLFLVEHFGQTTPDKTWGRAGVSAAGWHNAIAARSQAAHSLGFAGFISYAWSWNLMHAPDDDRLAFEQTYALQSLP